MKSKALSKKILRGLSVTVFAVLASCSSNGPADDAKKMCDLMREGEQLKAAGKMDELLKVMDQAKKLGQELDAKYKGDEEAQNLIEKKVEGCMADGQ